MDHKRITTAYAAAGMTVPSLDGVGFASPECGRMRPSVAHPGSLELHTALRAQQTVLALQHAGFVVRHIGENLHLVSDPPKRMLAPYRRSR